MRKLATVVLLLLIASVSYADKVKSKTKQKSFEPVVRSAAALAGAYRGPSEAHGLMFDLGPDGKLRGNYVELGHVAVLHAIEINGSDFTARASFDNGTWKTIHGSFANRVLNGQTAFGARVKDVAVDGMGQVDTFFERIN
ncbi:MAG: hypothetical protein ACLGH0_12735 [Thermoanaerobaculia bacterium]